MSDTQMELYNRLRENPLLWGKHYFPHYFRKASPAFHLQVIKTVINNRLVVIQSPRGSSKSTILSFLLPVHGIVFKGERFIVIVQNTYAKAAASLQNIKARASR